jgi:copper transporter 1
MDHMSHDMDSMASMTSTMTMAMSASSTASAAMSTGSSHSMGGMDMGGMDMGGMDGMHSCKISVCRLGAQHRRHYQTIVSR